MEILGLPINDAAKTIGVSRATVYRLLDAEKLESFKVGRRTLIKTDSIRALVEAA